MCIKKTIFCKLDNKDIIPADILIVTQWNVAECVSDNVRNQQSSTREMCVCLARLNPLLLFITH